LAVAAFGRSVIVMFATLIVAPLAVQPSGPVVACARGADR